MMNELWMNANFTLTDKFTDNVDFGTQSITLGQIPEPDCSAIGFNFTPINCSTVLSNCGSCSWWDAICWAGVAACQVANGVKYAACQADNAARLAVASAEWAASKALCYTEVAGIFILDKLILPVGVYQQGMVREVMLYLNNYAAGDTTSIETMLSLASERIQLCYAISVFSHWKKQEQWIYKW